MTELYCLQWSMAMAVFQVFVIHIILISAKSCVHIWSFNLFDWYMTLAIDAGILKGFCVYCVQS